MKRHPPLVLAFVVIFVVAFCSLAGASITEIRKDFFNRTANLPATAIISAPTGDASYLLSVYESTESCAIIPTLRWIDENGVAHSQQGSVWQGGGDCYVSLSTNVRVQAKTAPTVETAGAGGGAKYSIYVSGLGFWTSGVQRQGGLSEITGSVPTTNLVYALQIYQPSVSSNGLLVAYSTGYAGKDIPYISWSDEYGTNSLQVPVGTSSLIPMRIAGSTKVWIHTFPGDSTWYALIVFGTPAKGAGPFTDYEVNLLEWTSATYPGWQTLFTAGSAGANVLLLSDITEQANNDNGAVGLQASWTNQTSVPCAAALTAQPSGLPAQCVSPIFVGSNSPLQFRTYNTPGSPWGPSSIYSTEVDVLQF